MDYIQGSPSFESIDNLVQHLIKFWFLTIWECMFLYIYIYFILKNLESYLYLFDSIWLF